MAKVKGKKGGSGGVHAHIRARLDYLHRAASYLQSRSLSSNAANSSSNDHNPSELNPVTSPAHDGTETTQIANGAGPVSATRTHLPQVSRAYISQMRGVSLKTQLRLPVEVKRSFCKRCDTILVLGVNSTEEIRNASRGGRKPWANVRVVRCTTCGTEKRFPQTDRRGKKLSERLDTNTSMERQEPGAG
ncbi:RNAse P Rpr2/Rpp21/SNM1 subunit domain-containing protein [Aspergillus ambiguus]|uniref:ribonuclease P Rpr2/Rpp21/SNM1 subunit n=1 Tax=Aspergillus ambiguus TaxID=176160 RepID=UPI003CCE3BA5